MASKLIKYSLGLSFILAIFGTSCQSDYVANRQAETAGTGIYVYEGVGELYESLEELDHFYKYNGEYLQILIKDSTGVDFSKFGFETKGIHDIIELSHFTQKVYRSYEMLSDIGVGVEKSGIRGNFEMLAARLDSFSFPEEKQAMLSELKIAAKAHKFERKEIMFDISALYLDILEKDLQTRKAGLQTSLDYYDKALQMIPISAFDVEKVKPLIDAPLKDSEAIVKLYKLQLRDEAYKNKLELEARMDVLRKAMQTLNRVHAEFIKQNTSNMDIDQYLLEIKEMLHLKNIELED